jgi:hypothetical protein
MNDWQKDFLRIPGLFRRWEIEQVLDTDYDFRVEDAGPAADGTPLFAVYKRRSRPSATGATCTICGGTGRSPGEVRS